MAHAICMFFDMFRVCVCVSEEHNWQSGVTTSISLGFNAQFGVTLGGMESPVQAHSDFGFSANYDVSNSLTVGASSSTSVSYGQMQSNSEEMQQWLEASVPKSNITATLVSFDSRRDIPYTCDVEIVFAGGHVQHIIAHGVYTSVTTDSIIVSYSDAKPIDISSA